MLMFGSLHFRQNGHAKEESKISLDECRASEQSMHTSNFSPRREGWLMMRAAYHDDPAPDRMQSVQMAIFWPTRKQCQQVARAVV